MKLTRYKDIPNGSIFKFIGEGDIMIKKSTKNHNLFQYEEFVLDDECILYDEIDLDSYLKHRVESIEKIQTSLSNQRGV